MSPLHIVTRQVPKWRCPECGTVLDGLTTASADIDDSIPVEGSLSVCVCCHTVLRITSRGYTRAAESEWERADPVMRIAAEQMFGPLRFAAREGAR